MMVFFPYHSSLAFKSGLYLGTSPSKVHELIAKFDLVDVWRLQHSSEKDYMYYSPRHQVFTRIDYFLTDVSSVGKVSQCTIGLMLWMDHAWIECHLNTTSERDLHRRWMFDKNILLSDYWRQMSWNSTSN